MIEANGNQYKLVLIDTCIISEFIKQWGHPFSRKVLLKFFEDSIPSFSIQSFKELKFAPNLYEKFFVVFEKLPSFVMKDHEQIYREEISSYEEEKMIDAVLTNRFNNPFSTQNLNIKKTVDLIFTEKFQEKFKKDKIVILDGILSLKQNYPAKNDKYTKKEIDDFVEAAVLKQIVLRNRDWAKEKVDIEEPVQIERFPSLMMMGYIIFYKFYISGRKPQLSDVPDILMASLYPYVDVLFVEKNQAEMIRQIKTRHSFCTELEVHTMKDFRN